jgi:hypothetical protein
MTRDERHRLRVQAGRAICDRVRPGASDADADTEIRFLAAAWGPRHGRYVSLRPFLVDRAGYGGLVGGVLDVARLLRLHLGDGTSMVGGSCQRRRLA